MADKELLEYAAKAAGMPKGWFDDDLRGTYNWNPLTDDGDALRLAVKVKLWIYIRDTFTDVMTETLHETFITEPHGDDPYAATRRAIVRAAAEIGKGEKDE